MWAILLLFVGVDAISVQNLFNRIKGLRVNLFKLPLQIIPTNNNLDTNLEIALLNKTTNFHYFGTLPRLVPPNNRGQLTWYPIGFAKDFGKTPTRVTIRDINYVVWSDKNGYYGIRDCCSHQGSSFLLGETCKNTITCPYHGYIFNGTNGDLLKIPGYPQIEKSSHNVDCFKVVEKGEILYLNTIPIINEETREKIDEKHIFVEDEYYDNSQRAVFLQEDFEHYAKFVSVNSLDICHIGFVHTFGNRKNPNPTHNSRVLRMAERENHYKIIYKYLAGENSLVNKIYKFDNIIVENEYILPHTTVARVLFGNYSSTIITHALPISKFKTKLFVKAYRNYWYYNLNNDTNYIFQPFMHAISLLGDKVTRKTMYTTLKQDKAIVDNIDKTTYDAMHGTFSVYYDMFSNHYKNNYKKFYEDGAFGM